MTDFNDDNKRYCFILCISFITVFQYIYQKYMYDVNKSTGMSL